MNTGALGNADNQDNRTAPETETKKWWEKFALIIIIQEKIIDNLDMFIDLCIPDEATNNKWKVCIGFY